MADIPKTELDKDAGRRQSLFRGLTGRTGDVSGDTEVSTASMLRAAYGSTARGGIDTKAAAKDLGVSQRSVQRWIASEERQHARPRADRLKAIATKARQAATTQRGRKQALRGVRDSSAGKKMAAKGASISVDGRQGPSGAKATYVRQRAIGLSLSPNEVESLWAAYEQGGDKAASTWLTNHAGDNYLDGWQFESIDSLNMRPR